MNLNDVFKTDDQRDDRDHPYEDHYLTKWIIGVDFWYRLFVIKAPDIHPSFLEYQNAEEIGLGYDWPELEPGIYEIEYRFFRDNGSYYDPYDYDWGFEPIKVTPLMEYKKNKNEDSDQKEDTSPISK